MIAVELLLEFLNGLPEGAEVGITDGGLAIAAEDGENYLEVGGLPEGSAGADL